MLGAVDIATNLVLKPLLPLTILIVVALVPFLLFTGMTASNVNAAAAAHQQARVDLLGIIEAESSVLDSIDALGGDSSQSRFFQVRFNGMPEADRPQAAMAYVANLNKDLTRVFASTLPEQQIRAKEAKQQLDRLKNAVSTYENTRDSWSTIAQSMAGRTACRTGMATCPP